MPTETDIRAWTAAVGAEEHTDDLLGLLQRARVEYATWREAYRTARGAAGQQATYRQLEMRAAHIAEFQPAIVPGLLQTADYARELLALASGPRTFGSDDDDVERMAAARMDRQQVLYDSGKRIEMVMLEGGLRSRVCSPETLAGQLDRLIALSGLTTVELGVVPFTASVPVLPLTGFQLFDDLAVIETVTGEQRLDEPDEVAYYRRFFELLREAAVTGREAAVLLRAALAEIET